MLWQLKKLSSGEALSEPQKLPENWGPIFGLHGFTDRIGDLGWLGEAYNDMGWVIVGDAPALPTASTKAELEWERAKQLLRDSDWTMLSDVPLTVGEKQLWIGYRASLREIRLQAGFPSSIVWPIKPV